MLSAQSEIKLKFFIDSHRVFSRLIYQSLDPNPVIVLEDLCVDGFTVINKIPEDYEVSKKIVQRLAKFHASSFFLAEEKVRVHVELACHFPA